MEDTREGDRFFYKIHDVILEMILIDGVKSVMVVKFAPHTGWNHIGEVAPGYGWTSRSHSTMIEYLGNFAKAHHFESLYTKLCNQE